MRSATNGLDSAPSNQNFRENLAETGIFQPAARPPRGRAAGWNMPVSARFSLKFWLLGAESSPFVADRIVVLVGVVELDRQLQVEGGEAPDLLGKIELGDDLVVLGAHQV